MEVRKVYWSDVAVGEQLPDVTRGPLTRVDLVRYAGASGDYNPMHVDEVYAREVGMPGVSAHALYGLGILGEAVSLWMGSGGVLKRFGGRFVKLVWPGDVLTARGRVIELHHDVGTYTADLDLWVENQLGELVVKGAATVRLFHCAEDEGRHARGEAPLVVDTPPPPPLEERIGVPMAPLPRTTRSGRDKRASGAKKRTRGSKAAPGARASGRTVTRSRATGAGPKKTSKGGKGKKTK